jgi:hypothetical protein
MLTKGIDTNIIATETGLTIEKIELFKNQLKMTNAA